MRSLGLILLGTLGCMVLTLRGQVAAPASVDLYEEENQPDLTPTPSPEPNGPDLPELSQLDQAFKQTSLGKQADEYRLHIEWRHLKNRVVNDPQVQAAKASTRAARTDLERRNRFRDYYNVYYQRMLALASTLEMKAALEALKNAHVGLLAQPRVRPSPSASPASNASVAALNLVKQTAAALGASPTPNALKVAAFTSRKQAATGSSAVASSQGQEDANAMAAVKNAGLNTFLIALNLTHKMETLKANGLVTVFAPTDEAFQNAPPGTIDSQADNERLGELLDYHIVKGAIASGELTTRKLSTLNGASLDVKVTDGKIMVNDAHVIKADVKIPSGVVYVIDKVLVPPAE